MLELLLQSMALGRPGHLGQHVARRVGMVQQHEQERVLIHRHKMVERSAQETIPRPNTVHYAHVQVYRRLMPSVDYSLERPSD